jgi:hypothetical protein
MQRARDTCNWPMCDCSQRAHSLTSNATHDTQFVSTSHNTSTETTIASVLPTSTPSKRIGPSSSRYFVRPRREPAKTSTKPSASLSPTSPRKTPPLGSEPIKNGYSYLAFCSSLLECSPSFPFPIGKSFYDPVECPPLCFGRFRRLHTVCVLLCCCAILFAVGCKGGKASVNQEPKATTQPTGPSSKNSAPVHVRHPSQKAG